MRFRRGETAWIVGAERGGLLGEDHFAPDVPAGFEGLANRHGEAFVEKDLAEAPVEEFASTEEIPGGSVGEPDEGFVVDKEEGVVEGVEHGVPAGEEGEPGFLQLAAEGLGLGVEPAPAAAQGPCEGDGDAGQQAAAGDEDGSHQSAKRTR